MTHVMHKMHLSSVIIRYDFLFENLKLVNCNKTKTMIFGKNLKNRKNTKFSYEYRNTYLENVSEFKFLGNVITQNGNLVSCAEALSKKALKVMYSIKSYTSSLNELPVNVSTHLFDSLVRPILTYN